MAGLFGESDTDENAVVPERDDEESGYRDPMTGRVWIVMAAHSLRHITYQIIISYDTVSQSQECPAKSRHKKGETYVVSRGARWRNQQRCSPSWGGK
jgi:hypothetical protein